MGTESCGGPLVLDTDLEEYINYLRSMGCGQEEIEYRTKDVQVAHIIFEGKDYGTD